MYVMVLALAEPQARATPEKHHLLPFRHFGCFCGCQSLPLRLSLLFVCAGRGISWTSTFQSFTFVYKKKEKRKKNISVPGWYLHEFENPLLRCRALCLSSPSSMKEEQANAFLSVCTETSSESNRLQLAIFWPRG